ncbi:MAG: carotenoid oxygenase family protein [Alphaproteobacteria bacterium]
MSSPIETAIRATVTKGIVAVAGFNRSRLASRKVSNPYLEGVHKPMEAELTLETLDVTGSIPPELDGRYMRIGPNPASPASPATYHWFTGDGIVHRGRLKDGKALGYRNRGIRSRGVSQALGEPEAPGPRNGLGDTVNTNVLGHAGALWALVEAGGYPVRLNDNLETLAHDPFGGTLKGGFAAHPHRDPDTGEMHAICYEGNNPNAVRHVVLSPEGRVTRELSIPVRNGPSIHDCMITKTYVIILDLPVTFSMKSLLAGDRFPYRWNPDHQARVGLLPKTGTADDVIWCNVAPCYVFHPCNGFETAEGKVILDVCAHDTMFDGDRVEGPASKSTPFERWTIDPLARSVSRLVIDPDGQEFPRPNETRLGKPYRYAYAMALPAGFEVAASGQTRLFKHDLVAGTRQVHDFGPGRLTGEFVFVPRPTARSEDDGWLMGYVVNLTNETTDLVILNADDFEGPPQASIRIPHRIPPGFHGNWAPSEA